MTRTEIETKANELAAEIMTGETLKSFTALDLESKLTGIAVFAHAAGDVRVKNAAMAAYVAIAS